MCGNRITKRCHDQGLEFIGQKEEDCEKRLNKSFEHHDDYESTNIILQSMKEEKEQYGLHFYPAIVVNGLIFRGQMNPDNVFETICAAFKEMPAGCYEWESLKGIAPPD